MNLLLINHYAGSTRHGMEYRPYYLAREWVRSGYEATIVAASFSHLRTTQPAINSRITEEWIDGVRYLWYRTPVYRGNGLGRARNMFSFVRQIWRDAPRLAGKYRPDAVIASSTYPMDIYPALRLARACSAKLVYEVHDIWPLSPVELDIISPWNPLAIVSQWAEDYACCHADRIISLLPKAGSHFESRGMAPHKFAWIPNGIDVAEWNSADATLPQEHVEAISTLRRRGAFLVGYAGGHGISNSLNQLIDAASHLRATPAVFVLVGKGTHKTNLQRKASELGLTNIAFLSPIEKTAIPAFLRAMDALYLGWNRERVYRFGISPNKLMDYMMSARPVIHAVEAANDPVAESGCGISCPPENAPLLADAVQRMMRLTSEERDTLGQRGRDYVVRHHDYAVLARRFVEVVS
jgi:glycosyltransferase involved in cell wall biosynthesis